MRIEIKRLDPNLIAGRLGRGRVFTTPDDKVGIVRQRLVTSIGFLRRPILRHTSDHWRGRHLDAYAIGVFIHDTIGIVAEVVRGLEWLVRSAAEAIGRAAGAPFVIEALLDDGQALYWKVSGRKLIDRAIDEVIQAMSIGDLEFVPSDGERLLVD